MIGKGEDTRKLMLHQDADGIMAVHITQKAREGLNKEPERNIACKVDLDMCREMREMYSNGMSIREIKETTHLNSKSAVYYHINDNCSHRYSTIITYDECGWMRFYAHRGAPTGTLAILHDVHNDTAAMHITGRCRHEHGCEPMDGQELHALGKRKTAEAKRKNGT